MKRGSKTAMNPPKASNGDELAVGDWVETVFDGMGRVVEVLYSELPPTYGRIPWEPRAILDGGPGMNGKIEVIVGWVIRRLSSAEMMRKEKELYDEIEKIQARIQWMGKQQNASAPKRRSNPVSFVSPSPPKVKH